MSRESSKLLDIKKDMASISSKKTIRHFTHNHPLAELSANKEFLSGGCGALGNGTRYRCEPCNFDLHHHCGTCPMELTSFLHQQHDLKLVVCKLQQDHVCELCDDPVEGLFYRCEECDFNVHPLCTLLPKELMHAMHKDHPLRLQAGSVPGTCMVCNETCTSWHYRCGICCFNLHIECVLAPCCKEAATTTSTPRSLNAPIPPPSPSPCFDHNYHGYGAITPTLYRAYGGGDVPFVPPHGALYGHGYGTIRSPPYRAYGGGRDVPFVPPYGAPYGYGYGPIRPPPYWAYGGGGGPFVPSNGAPYGHDYGDIRSPPYNWAYGYGIPFGPPNLNPYDHGYGLPYSSGVYVNGHHANNSQIHGVYNTNSQQISSSSQIHGVYNANSQ